MIWRQGTLQCARITMNAELFSKPSRCSLNINRWVAADLQLHTKWMWLGRLEADIWPVCKIRQVPGVQQGWDPIDQVQSACYTQDHCIVTAAWPDIRSWTLAYSLLRRPLLQQYLTFAVADHTIDGSVSQALAVHNRPSLQANNLILFWTDFKQLICLISWHERGLDPFQYQDFSISLLAFLLPSCVHALCLHASAVRMHCLIRSKVSSIRTDTLSVADVCTADSWVCARLICFANEHVCNTILHAVGWGWSSTSHFFWHKRFLSCGFMCGLDLPGDRLVK